MRAQLRVAAIAVFAASLSIAGSARAAFIAGWDFTQYTGAGTLQISEDPNTFEPITRNTLRSNYSDFDPTFGAGGDSQPFGTMWMNGTNGSTLVDPDSTNIILPTTGSLAPNLSTPGDNEVPIGDVAFDASAGVLQVGAGNYEAGTGQDYRNLLSMRALSNVSVVFEANLSALSSGENWSLTFAGVSSTATSDVTIEFSSDGINYAALTAASLTTTAAAFTRSVVGNAGDNAFFRLGFTSTGANPIPRFDNVTISADVTVIPEPGTAALFLLGLVGLGVAGRRRA